jgi:alpha-amylase
MSEFNGVMMQYFHWYNEPDGSLWNQLAENAEHLAKVGITSVWLPPAYKGTGGGYDVGYGVYDMFDLGEFDQKDTVRTKYGTKEEYINAIKVAKKFGIRTYADVVLNHKLGADQEEEAEATPMNPHNRHEAMGGLDTFYFPWSSGKIL